MYRENIDEYYGILAEHFILSNNYEKGAEYSKKAGKNAVLRPSYSDAIYYAKKCVSCLELLPKTDTIQKRIIDERTALSNYCMGINYHNEGMKAVAPIVNLTKEINYKKRLPRIYVASGTYNFIVKEDIVKGIEDLTKAKKYSEEVGDFLSLWFSCYFLGSAHWLLGEYVKSNKYLEMTLELSRAGNNETGICFSLCSNAVYNFIAFTGKLELAYNLVKESIDIANKVGDIYIQQIVFSCYGSYCLAKGSFEEAETYFLKAVTLYAKTKHVVWGAWAFYWLGELYFSIRSFEKSQYYYNKANLIIEPHKGFPSWVNLAKLKLIRAKVMQKDKDIYVESLFEYESKNKWRIYEGIIPNHIGCILMNTDIKFISEAEIWINKAIEANKQIGNQLLLADDYVLYAELLQRKGTNLDAKEMLNKAVDIYQECGADGWVERYETKLAEL